MKRVLVVLAVLAVVTCCINLPFPKGGGSEPSGPLVTEDPSWDALKVQAIDEFATAGGWGTPELVGPPVNTIGWEDSANISPDGRRLTFAYLPVDLLAFQTEARGNLKKWNRFRRGPLRDNSPEFAVDLYVSRRTRDGWTAPELHPVSRNADPAHASEHGLFEAADGSLWYCSNAPTTPTQHKQQLYVDGKKLPFCSLDVEDSDPCYVDGELFFESQDRRGGPGKKDIFVARRNPDGTWNPPRPLPEPVNSRGADWMPFLHDDDLYFVSDRDGPHAIYVSPRQGEGWGQPTRVVWPKKGAAAAKMVSEPTLTADGSTLYFCALFQDPAGDHDLDIAFVRRAP